MVPGPFPTHLVKFHPKISESHIRMLQESYGKYYLLLKNRRTQSILSNEDIVVKANHFISNEEIYEKFTAVLWALLEGPM